MEIEAETIAYLVCSRCGLETKAMEYVAGYLRHPEEDLASISIKVILGVDNAAVCPFDGDLDALILPDVNAQSMSLFLQELSLNHAREHIVLVLDRAGWHTAKDLNVPQNITLYRLPPYSPELNPVEHLWDEIREKWFLNRYFASLDSVENQLVLALKTLMENPNLVTSICLFNWMIN